jgi:hypothetical protein
MSEPSVVGFLLTAGSYDLPAIQALITTGRDGGSWAGHGLR